MAETGFPRTAVERGNKRTAQQHFVPPSLLATDQEENDAQDLRVCVDSSLDPGILYLNPLTPKWNCGIAERPLEVSSEEEEQELWVQRKDNDDLNLAEKAKNSIWVASKLNQLKYNQTNLIQQTPAVMSIKHLAENISSTSSEEMCAKNVVGSKKRKAVKNLSKQLMMSKLRLCGVKKHHLNEQSTNRNNRIIRNCSDIPTTSSEEKTIWVRSNDDVERKLVRTVKLVTPEKNPNADPPTEQSTSEKKAFVEKRAQNSSSESEGKDDVKAETKMAESHKQLMTKLKDLHVNRDNSVSLKDLCKDDAKMSRLLEAMKKRGEIDSEQRPFKCTHCHWAFKKLCYLQSHLTTHSGLKPHVCDKCGKAYSHQGTLQQHKRLHTGERPYLCPFCDRSYIWSSDYRKHIRTHTGEKPYECKECGKEFIRSSDLRKHERNMHTNNKPFQCSHCDKTFNRPLSLKRHERKHLGERPYSCPDCGKKFALESRMSEHQKIHRGVRPFVCAVCDKCFTKSSNLTEHEAIHSGIRPHKCGECGVAFAMASRLVRHQYTHNIGRIHSCGGCSRNFSCSANLEQHQQLNCAGRIFVCVQCDKSFRCADKLAQHMQHHNDNIVRPN